MDLSVCWFWWIGAEEERSSPTRNLFKVRSFKVAAAAIEKLDFKVQHGDELAEVRPVPSRATARELIVELFSVLQVQGVGLGTRKRINVYLGHEEVRRSRLRLQPRGRPTHPLIRCSETFSPRIAQEEGCRGAHFRSRNRVCRFISLFSETLSVLMSNPGLSLPMLYTKPGAIRS